MSKSLISVPNALTFLRFLGIPLFIYLTLWVEADGWAIVVLAVGGATDYFDGKIARAWNQTSRFGELADPAIDRLYILSTLIVFLIRDIVPVWMIALIIGRDVVLAVITLLMNRKGIPPFTVTYLGKAATFKMSFPSPRNTNGFRQKILCTQWESLITHKPHSAILSMYNFRPLAKQ
jgi:cardiolipin synthase